MGKALCTDMPVSEVSAELDTVGLYNRLSASQVNAYNSCQRLWFYEKVLKLKIKQIPVLYVEGQLKKQFAGP